MTGITLPNDPDWIFSYDECPDPSQSESCDGTFEGVNNLKGRLAEATNGTVTTTRGYSSRGELAIERTTIGGETYDVIYGYDDGGRIASVQAPSEVATAYADVPPETRSS